MFTFQQNIITSYFSCFSLRFCHILGNYNILNVYSNPNVFLLWI